MAQQPHLLERAQKLRNESSPFEIKLWRHLSRSQLGGYKFRRQHVIGNCIVDFFCPQKALIVEVDGETHDARRDEVRDRRHRAAGFATMRVTNQEVGKNLEGVLQAVLSKLETLPDRWPGTLPHPAASRPPSPEGEGK